MRIAFLRTIALILCVVLTVCMLSGCKKEEMFQEDNLHLADTIWEYAGDYYAFYPDGTIRTYNSEGVVYEGYEGAYVVSGDICKMAYGGATYTVTKDGEALVAVDDQNETFRFNPAEKLPTLQGEPVEEVPEVQEQVVSIDENDANALDIRNTTWETEGLSYHFYADGSVEADNGSSTMLGTYGWDGYHGSLTMDGTTVTLLIDGGALCIQGEDGYLYMLVETAEGAN